MDTLRNLESLNLILPCCFTHLSPGNKLIAAEYIGHSEDVEWASLKPSQGCDASEFSSPKLHLGPPCHPNNPFNASHENITLKGYNILYKLRHKTSEFRKGYINWRQFKPKGARGEASDVVSRIMEENSGSVDFPQIHVEQNLQEILHKTYRTNESQNLAETSQNDLVYLQRIANMSTFHASGKLLQPSTLTDGTCALVESVSTPTLVNRDHCSSTLTIKTHQGVISNETSFYSNEDSDDKDKWLRFYYNPFTPVEERQALPISSKNLKSFATSSYANILVPLYNRDPTTVTHWILHIGVGQFHRAHQLVYMDDYLTQQHQDLISHSKTASTQRNASGNNESHELQNCSTPGAYETTQEKWGYCGIGLTEYDGKIKSALSPQDYLFTVLERNNKKSAARIVGSMFDFFLAYESPEKALNYLISPNVCIVSLTVTEKGYCQHVDGNLDTGHPWIIHDLHLLKQNVSSSNRSLEKCPKSAIGLIVWGLFERRQRGLNAFTILSCDNLPNNGSVTKSMLMAFANQLDASLAQWIDIHASFPATMVDRITPIVVDEHREILAKDFGILDKWPVVTEVFHQWVIEDVFPYGRPAWEKVGVLLVSDVRPFELVKLRILNGGHSIVGYLSYLMGYTFIDDAMTDLRISSFLRSYMDEVTYTLPGFALDLDHYKETVIERFGNRLIKDALLRICEDGSSKFFNTLRNATMQLIQEQRHITSIALGVAGFLVFLATTKPEIVKDAHRTVLIVLATQIFDQPLSLDLVSMYLKQIFGEELGNQPFFCHHVALSIMAIKKLSPEIILNRGGVLPSLFYHHMASPNLFSQLVDLALQQ